MGNVSVILEPQPPQGFLATAVGWSNCHAQGMTEAAALDNLRQLLLAKLQTAKVVSLDIYGEHPLVKLSGIFKDNPQFETMLEFIEPDRQDSVELDGVAMRTETPSEDAWDRMFGAFIR